MSRGSILFYVQWIFLLESAKLLKTSYQKANEDLVLKVFSHFDMQSSYSSDKLYVHYFQERNTLMENIWKQQEKYSEWHSLRNKNLSEYCGFCYI